MVAIGQQDIRPAERIPPDGVICCVNDAVEVVIARKVGRDRFQDDSICVNVKIELIGIEGLKDQALVHNLIGCED